MPGWLVSGHMTQHTDYELHSSLSFIPCTQVFYASCWFYSRIKICPKSKCLWPLAPSLPLPLSKPPPSHPRIVAAALSLLSPSRLFLTQHPEWSPDNLKQITVAPYSIQGKSRSSYQGPSVIQPWLLLPTLLLAFSIWPQWLPCCPTSVPQGLCTGSFRPQDALHWYLHSSPGLCS